MEKIIKASSETINNISALATDEKSGITFEYENERRVLSNNYHTLVIGEEDNQKVEKVISPLINPVRALPSVLNSSCVLVAVTPL